MSYLYDELVKYCGSDAYPFHMPGHKRQLGSFQDPFSFDITEIDGFDNLHHAEGIMLEAEKRAAKLYGSEETHFLVNGSTAGILSAIGAATRHGGRLLMARASHKAAYHAVSVYELETVYLNGESAAADFRPAECRGRESSMSSEWFGDHFLPPECGECGRPVDASEVERVLAEDRLLHPESGRIQAVYITSPTYDGVASDVKRIAEITHSFGIPLIVDEAHGAHFGMHPIFPESSVKLGADLVIHSLHKTLPSLTSTALLHVQGSLVDRRRVRDMLNIYQTSSPSYVLMASIDNCIRILQERGPELFDRLADHLKAFYDSVSDLTQIGCIRTDDPSKILLMPLTVAEIRPAGGLAPDGDHALSRELAAAREPVQHTAKELYDTLRLRFHLQPEMLSRSYVCMLSSVGDSEEGFRRLSHALHEIDREWSEERKESLISQKRESGHEEYIGAAIGVSVEDASALSRRLPGTLPEREETVLPEAVLPIGAAQDAEQEKVPFDQTPGRVSGEYLYLYPPGIPLVTPGEKITPDMAAKVRKLMADGYSVEGADDYSLQYLWCVKTRETGT